MLAVDIHTRRIIGFAAHAGDVNGIIACRLLNQILGGRSPPARVSTDHDPIFKHHRWQATLRVLDIDEVKTVPYTPLSHPVVERTIGTVRREFLDQTLFWREADLSRKQAQYRTYYSKFRGHLSLDGKTPAQIAERAYVPKQPIHNYSWISHCSGLFNTPMACQY
jgi:transposase InsO family protein